ncbi:hypothetical protein RCG24_14400 [Neobacillus sp. OS1-32]|jgi:hypothetical protein|uniref:hypothetical protein n=1 Tax=Neobacillus sp. OS1-32 TaxID=3070682 RepID=UPI0027DFDC61|nr:hypothetical protein [Neobacillus sp. OS1-32]WML29180.1 hypothetical protein RCG24_14400 [Neobacillus sp. OS1-32]
MEKHQQPYSVNDDYQFVQFPVEAVKWLKTKNLDIVISSNVVELEGDQQLIREVKLEWTTPKKFNITEI